MAKNSARASPAPNYSIVGASGLNRYGGYVSEDLRRELHGSQGMQVYHEMRDDDPIIGAIILAITNQVSKVQWRVVPANDSPEARAAQEFLESCKDDMSHSWSDFISEVMSMAVFGWSYFERVYKRRLGDSSDPTTRSRYRDGRIGWRKFSIRGQESLLNWDFQPEDGGIAGMTQFDLTVGTVMIPIEKALLFRTRINKANPEGVSLLRGAYRTWYLKKNVEKIEVEGIERDLKGVPLIEIPPEDFIPIPFMDSSGTIDLEKQAEENARSTRLRQITDQAIQLANSERKYLIMPARQYSDMNAVVETGGNYPLVISGYNISLLSSGGTRSHDTNAIIKRFRQDIALSTLCQFLLLGMDGSGARATSEDHSLLWSESIGYLLTGIEGVLNSIAVRDLMRLNGFPPEVWPTFKYGEIRPMSLEQLSNYVSTLTGENVIIADEKLEDHVRGVAGLPARDPKTARVATPAKKTPARKNSQTKEGGAV